MSRFRLVRASALVALVLAVACAAPNPGVPPVSTSCQSDADCELVNGLPPQCCSRCEPTAMTRAAADAARKQCRAVEGGDYFSRCPHLSCTCTRTAPRCVERKCVVQSQPC